jgi:hypothetical protein
MGGLKDILGNLSDGDYFVNVVDVAFKIIEPLLLLDNIRIS